MANNALDSTRSSPFRGAVTVLGRTVHISDHAIPGFVEHREVEFENWSVGRVSATWEYVVIRKELYRARVKLVKIDGENQWRVRTSLDADTELDLMFPEEAFTPSGTSTEEVANLEIRSFLGRIRKTYTLHPLKKLTVTREEVEEVLTPFLDNPPF